MGVSGRSSRDTNAIEFTACFLDHSNRGIAEATNTEEDSVNRIRAIVVTAAVAITATTPAHAQPKSALEFYDSTGANATARFGWEGDEADGKFFLQAPVGTDVVTVEDGNMDVSGEITAAKVNGDGSGLTNIGSGQIADESIMDDDISPMASISGDKIDPDFGNSSITTKGSVIIEPLHPTAPSIRMRTMAESNPVGSHLSFEKSTGASTWDGIFHLMARSSAGFDNFAGVWGDMDIYGNGSYGGSFTVGGHPPGDEGGVRIHHKDTCGHIISTHGSLKLEPASGVAFVGNHPIQVSAPSDIRLKQNIEPLSEAVSHVQQLNGVYFDWRNETEAGTFGGGRQVGLIAQDVEKVLPEVVGQDARGYKSVDYEKVVPLLVEAIKEQQKQIDALKDALERRDSAGD